VTAETLKHVAREAEDSDAAAWGARAGLVARGLLWLVVGLLAANLALGGGGRADKQGALAAIRDQPFGKVLLVVLAAAFAAHAAFRLLEGTVGRRDEQDERKRWLKRAWSLCRVGIYGFLAGSTITFLLHGGGSQSAKRPTADAMGLPGGRWIVGLVGAGVVAVGLVMAFKGVRQDFTDKLRLPGGSMRTVVERTGTVGLAGRGLVYALVGSFLVEAAWTYDPDKAKGLDEGLRSLAGDPLGEVLLSLAVAGMLAFALWSFLEARYRDL
jgi:H+/Cl- antiporter ClcA